MTAPSLGGFGGYDPNSPPPGYDPICWAATNWDLGHGLSCFVPKAPGAENTLASLTPAQRSKVDAALLASDDPTVLLTDLRSWLPWTADFGSYPPPADSVYGKLAASGACLPWPGKLTQQQAVALYNAVRPLLPGLSNSAFSALVTKIKTENPEQFGSSWTPVNPTPEVKTTFDDGTVLQNGVYTKPDGTTYTTATEAGLGPAAPSGSAPAATSAPAGSTPTQTAPLGTTPETTTVVPPTLTGQPIGVTTPTTTRPGLTVTGIGDVSPSAGSTPVVDAKPAPAGSLAAILQAVPVWVWLSVVGLIVLAAMRSRRR